MKKVFFVIALLANFQIVFAQTEKGKFIIGSTLGFSTASGDHFKTSVDVGYNNYQDKLFDIAPTVGYFFKDNHMIGGGALFSKGSGFSDVSYFNLGERTIRNYDSYNYGGQIFYRNYFPLSKRLYLTPEFGFSFQTGKGDGSNNISQDLVYIGKENYTDRFNQARLFTKLNLSYFVSKKLSLDINLGTLELNHRNVTREFTKLDNNNQIQDSYKSRNSITNFNSQFLFNNARFGVQYYF